MAFQRALAPPLTILTSDSGKESGFTPLHNFGWKWSWDNRAQVDSGKQQVKKYGWIADAKAGGEIIVFEGKVSLACHVTVGYLITWRDAGKARVTISQKVRTSSSRSKQSVVIIEHKGLTTGGEGALPSSDKMWTQADETTCIGCQGDSSNEINSKYNMRNNDIGADNPHAEKEAKKGASVYQMRSFPLPGCDPTETVLVTVEHLKGEKFKLLSVITK